MTTWLHWHLSDDVESKIERALALGLRRMVEDGDVPAEKVGQTLENFGVVFTLAELRLFCERQGWSLRGVHDQTAGGFVGTFLISSKGTVGAVTPTEPTTGHH